MENSRRRTYPGTSAAALRNWDNQDFEDIDTQFQMAQYIQQNVRKNPKDVENIIQMPEDQDEQVWQLEQIRQLVLELNGLAIAMIGHNTLKDMTVGEEKYLDGVFSPPREVDAMTYIWHTLDWASNQLQSAQNFPSRLSVEPKAAKLFPTVMRRIYRIFAHANYHFPEIFQAFEAQHALCARFHAIAKKFGLMSPDNLTVVLS